MVSFHRPESERSPRFRKDVHVGVPGRCEFHRADTVVTKEKAVVKHVRAAWRASTKFREGGFLQVMIVIIIHGPTIGTQETKERSNEFT